MVPLISGTGLTPDYNSDLKGDELVTWAEDYLSKVICQSARDGSGTVSCAFTAFGDTCKVPVEPGVSLVSSG